MMKRYKRLIEHFRSNKKVFTLYFILRLFVIGVMIAQFYNKNYENVFLCILTLFLFMVPSFIEVNFQIDFPDTLEIIILLFIFSAEILGEISSYYITYPFWDTMLHTINGFLAAAVGFSMVNILNKHDKFLFQLSPLFTSIVSFCFSMTIGVIWEFFEYAMDMLFGYDMQKDTIIRNINTVTLDETLSNVVVRIKNIDSVWINGIDLGLPGYLDIGLIDTMKDLIVNFIGAIVFSIIGYFYVKYQGKGKTRIANNFITVNRNWKLEGKIKGITKGKTKKELDTIEEIHQIQEDNLEESTQQVVNLPSTIDLEEIDKDKIIDKLKAEIEELKKKINNHNTAQ